MKSEWTPLATDFFQHPKVVEVDGPAKLLFVAGLCYAQHNLTDGHVTRRATRLLFVATDADQSSADQLVEVGLWTTTDDGYAIPNWSEWNQPAEAVKEKRQRESNRKQEWREAKKAKFRPSDRDAGRDASRDVGRDGDATRSRRSTPTPTPTERTSTSTGTSPGATEPEVEEVIGRIVELRYEAEKDAVRNPQAWRIAVRTEVVNDGTPERIREMRDRYPTASASQLADAVEGRTQVLRYLPRNEEAS